MSRPPLFAGPALSLAIAGGVAAADTPRVATDIAPVHSLVSMVMQGAGEPGLVIPAGATPHEYQLRPSDARLLESADLVFWVGQDLTPWLGDALGTLAGNAQVISLLELDATERLEFREDALFEGHDDDHEAHGHGEAHGHDDHGHDAHERHEHAEGEHAHDDHGHDDHAHDDHGHDHGEIDAHAWLSPQNATAWIEAIRAELSEADPSNAELYAANAAAATAEISDLATSLRARLEPLSGRGFIVFHDAYQYFEVAMGLPASGAISMSDAADPSPARLAEIRDRIRRNDILCVLAEPQFNPGLVTAVSEASGVRDAVADPLGVGLVPGPDLYASLLQNLAASLEGCLGDGA